MKSSYLIVIFAVYVVLLAITVAHHEPWMDEAQAWLLAKDASILDLFIKYLRYEGSPGLWHLVLMVPAKLGFPYCTLNIISALIAAGGVFLFLLRSPFPLAIRILFPFTYFIFFQYGVVARSYSMVPLLLFLAAANYKSKVEHPFRFVLPLCLLANVSVHTFLIAGGIMGVHALDVGLIWKQLGTSAFRRQLAALCLYAVVSVFVIVLLLPPADHFLGGGNNWSPLNFIYVAHWTVPAALVLNEASDYLLLGRILSLAIFFTTVWWLWRRKLAFLYLLPLFLLLGLFAVRYRNFWHDGVTFCLWIFVLWIGWEKRETIKECLVLEHVFPVIVTVVLAIQIYWAGVAVTSDLTTNYSASRDVAEYIKVNQLQNKRIFISGWKTAAIQPYFDRNIFYNYNDGSELRFWNWSTSNQTPLGAGSDVLELISTQEPDVVIFASDHLDATAVPVPPGYRLEFVFPGYQYWKTGVQELNAYWLFRRIDNFE